MSTVETLIDVGKVLKDAADAVQKLADAIAHIIRLGDTAWSELSARRTRERLRHLYWLTDDYRISQRPVLTKFNRFVECLPEQGDADDEALHVRKSYWDEATQELQPLIKSVTDLLSDLRAERGDFVLEDAYRSLRETLSARNRLLNSTLERSMPVTEDEIAELRRAVAEWDRLHEELGRAADSLRVYLKEEKTSPPVQRRRSKIVPGYIQALKRGTIPT